MEVFTLTIELISSRFYSEWTRVVEFTEETMLAEIHEFIWTFAKWAFTGV